MNEFEIYKKYYNIKQNEYHYADKLKKIIEENLELFSDSLLTFYSSEGDLKDFFANNDHRKKFKKNVTTWLRKLFSPPFDKDYAAYIKNIGIIHANNNVNPHYINVGIGIIRQTLTDIVRNYVSEVDERVKIINIANRLLDFNLDIINSNTRKKELENKFLKVRVESKLLSFAEGFSHFLNIIIIILLVLLSGAILIFFVKDFSMIFHGKIEEGIITTLGTMLILWMMIELIEVEIKNIKTKTINIVVFISVVLVAFIRKILIMTFEHPKLEKQIFLVGTVLILAIVHYLIYKSRDE